MVTVTDNEGKTGTDSTLIGVRQDPVAIDASGTLGVDILVKNKSPYVLTNLGWSVVFSGLLLASQISRWIPVLSEQHPFSTHIPVVV